MPAIDEVSEPLARALIEMNFGGRRINEWSAERWIESFFTFSLKGRMSTTTTAAPSSAASNTRLPAAGINHDATTAFLRSISGSNSFSIAAGSLWPQKATNHPTVLCLAPPTPLALAALPHRVTFDPLASLLT